MNKDWINLEYLKNVKKYSQEFKNNKPFEHLSLNNFLNNEKAEELSEMFKEFDYYLEDHDLYQFLRTVDFKEKLQNKKVNDLYNYIFSEDFISFIEELTETKLSRQRGDLHSLKLQNGHYLLCHDDQVQDRYLAFIINLSKDLKEENGGSLDLFDEKEGRPNKIVKKVYPKFNQFNIFLVSDKSFHQINEVIGDVTRESISGWFYK